MSIDQSIYFPVKEVSDFTFTDNDNIGNGEFTMATGHKAIVRTDTNQLIGIHGSRYKLTPNSEVFPKISQALARSDIDCTDMQIRDQTSHNGARTFREYRFPNHMIEIGQRDLSMLRLIARHSYDGSASFSLDFGAWRMICSNGMVIGSTFSHMRHKNTLGIDVPNMLAKLSQGFHKFNLMAENWKRWAQTPITEEQALAVIQDFPGINDTLETALLHNFRDEVHDLGSTVWALFNALTNWSSHADVRDAHLPNVASIVAAREARVEKAITQEPFTNLAMAA